MDIAIIVAMDKQGLIGQENDLPWKLSADLQYFRKITMGKCLIMGRHTHESIGRALPGRKNIILTRNEHYQAQDCTVVTSLEDALAAVDTLEVMIIGGASLYKTFLPHANRLYLTQVHAILEGDTWFPKWDKTQWQQVKNEDHFADEKNNYDYSFNVLERHTEKV